MPPSPPSHNHQQEHEDDEFDEECFGEERADWCFKLHYHIWCEVCNEIWQGKLT